MKDLIFICLLLGITFSTTAQQTNPRYDPALADSLGADDYGMKSYVLAILETGNTAPDDQTAVREAFSGHMANIRRLVEAGKLLIAGPLGPNDDRYRGIFIFDVATVEEARELVSSDPAIQEGYLDVKLYPWYGSAALPMYLDAADKIWKENP
ncbi:Uncharacterized conserved protein YciI, contains a putative active-site phosphohistidine [Cyclobacterium lianum]|uniref:Uncharacterized conserved protein YciI, contains a putative active-site phosphohistidine n=1 Tax=Cyclobacterium lianum TaxID=388280 RepID=A0A1M7KCU2_9BACT|nr:YciI family protein [Cyclobacterium lianum]SHM63119.1 Uncharacterized conserved protein YciI, contains a putative active-site phosphohistidine [Cyclobacterium lianum]